MRTKDLTSTRDQAYTSVAPLGATEVREGVRAMAIIVKRHAAKMRNALIHDPESGTIVANNKAGRKVPKAEQLRAMSAWLAMHPAPTSDDVPF